MENNTNTQTNNYEDFELMSTNTTPNDMQLLKDAAKPDGGNSFFTSIIDDGSREKKIAIYNAINKSDKKIDDYKGQKLYITDFAAHPVRMVTDDGELIEALRIVLIDKDGICYETVAGGVLSSLQKIFGIVGMAPWKPALCIIPTEVKTRKGFKTLTITLG